MKTKTVNKKSNVVNNNNNNNNNNSTSNNNNNNNFEEENEGEEIDLEDVKKKFQEFKIKNKQKKEEHEKEIKKMLVNENTHDSSSVQHTGVKRSKPLQPFPAFHYFKEANSTKSGGWCLEKWRELVDHEKKTFYDLAQKDKERYQIQLEEYEKIHTVVTHQKIQKKQKKKIVSSEDDENSEQKNQGPKKLTKKEKLKKIQEDKIVVKQNRLNGFKKSTTASVSTSKNTVNIKNNSEGDDDNQDEDEEEDDDEDEDEDDDDDEDEEDDDDEENSGESNHSAYEDGECYIDEDGGDGWADMKRGFKSTHHNHKVSANGRRVKWNK